eukprot:scaffold264542_cov27-Tisochrysis_lutea.AAC.1
MARVGTHVRLCVSVWAQVCVYVCVRSANGARHCGTTTTHPAACCTDRIAARPQEDAASAAAQSCPRLYYAAMVATRLPAPQVWLIHEQAKHHTGCKRNALLAPFSPVAELLQLCV